MPQPVIEFMRHTAADAQAHAQAIRDMRAKLDAARQAGDGLAIVDHAADLASLLTTDRQELEALQLLQAYADAADARPHEEPAGWFWNAYATALQYTGRRAEADSHFAKAVAMSAASGWSRLQALALHHWGRNLVEQGRLDEAESRIAEALAIRVARNDPRQDSSRRALDALAKLRCEG